ncbi:MULTISPECIES: type II secretion system F family protein [Lysinibacillus]|uniref:Pilus assembly protein TadB n=1 Tax=Lysinibacillus antri TaxID=2498145 RepID=A0A3S0RK66_9BACI|nr:MULTISPECIES: type II secretion system F family protein [Lysinibacillus]RUL54219.1 pilus assembly protein TadB [Lysinibacillus antri]TSI04283.1 pilus assembly protein TadB [Lysinibacillus sp. BW-2-10]
MDGIIAITIILTVLFFGIALRAVYVYGQSRRELKRTIADTLYTYDTFQKKVSRNEKVLKKILHFADDFSELGQRINFFSENADVKKWLIQAGHPYGLTVERFQGLKMFLLIFGVIAGGIMLVLGFPFAQFLVILLPIGGYMFSILWIRSKANARQSEISYQLPDFLDTMSVTLQAGVSMNQALRDIVPYFEGPIKEEFSRFLQELSIGVPKVEAYRLLLERNDSKEFQILIKSLIQGERLGVPIADSFKQQAEEMRKLKKEMIKEKAAKASPKVTLVTTFIILPSALIFIGGLMIINMFNQNNGIFELFQ